MALLTPAIQQREACIRAVTLHMSDMGVGYVPEGMSLFEQMTLTFELALVDLAVGMIAHERGITLTTWDQVRLKSKLLNDIKGFRPLDMRRAA
jgi:hypothetical protein